MRTGLSNPHSDAMNRLVPGLTLISLLLLLTLCTAANAQLVSVSQSPVMLNDSMWSIDLRVKNLTSRPLSVISGVAFRIIRSDDDGHLYLDSAITWEEMGHSCAAWMKVSPRELILPARSWRTLRVAVNSPSSLSDGEFWCNLVIRGQPDGELQADARQDSTVTGLATTGELSIPIVVRKGAVATGMEIEKITAHQRIPQVSGSRNDTVWNGAIVLVDTRRLGNGAYRGTMLASIRKPDGTEVAASTRTYSLFWDRRLRLEFPRLKDGSYVLSLESRTETDDDDAEQPILAPAVHKDVHLRVEGTLVEVRED